MYRLLFSKNHNYKEQYKTATNYLMQRNEHLAFVTDDINTMLNCLEDNDILIVTDIKYFIKDDRIMSYKRNIISIDSAGQDV